MEEKLNRVDCRRQSQRRLKKRFVDVLMIVVVAQVQHGKEKQDQLYSGS